MNSAWPDDLALSATFLPGLGLTLGVFYGCSPEQRNEIIIRLRNSEDAFLHPLFAVGIFCELERSRLVQAANTVVDNFVDESVGLPEGGRELREIISGNGKVPHSLENYANSNHLARAFKEVQRQLKKIIDLAEELRSFPALQAELAPANIGGGLFNKIELTREHDLFAIGKRIQLRLQEISAEYQGKIEECESYMKEMSHTIQTVSYTRLHRMSSTAF